MTLSDSIRGEQPASRLPVLETSRLVLRAPRLGDAKAIAMLANDRRVAEATARIPHPYPADAAHQWIAASNTRFGEETYAILRDGVVIGTCAFDLREGAEPEIGYWLGVPYWGQGYATEAVRALINRAFGELDHSALVSGARVTNPASRRVLEKCGFRWTGVALYRFLSIGTSVPCDRFRLQRSDWMAHASDRQDWDSFVRSLARRT